MEVRQRRPYNATDGSVIHNAFDSRQSSDIPNHFSNVSLWQWLVIFAVILFFMIAAPFQQSCSDILPTTKVNASFQENFAREHLKSVTYLGPRTCGSVANEVHAKNYLLATLTKFATSANASGLLAEVDDHVSASSSFKAHAHITSYSNIHNVVLRLHDPRVERRSQPRAILVNCHYDSVPGSPGASDDFVNCAISLEIIRILSQGDHKLLNDAIFLFNSAEETILTASHAFITQHRWASDIATFVNIEGAGAGGKLLLFQSGPGPASSVLVDLFSASTCRPYGNIIGEEIFAWKLVPSDTDFRVFRDYGNIPGLDMAYVTNGYAYHSQYDNEQRISVPCMQLSGENLLQLVKAMTSDPRVQDIGRLTKPQQTFSKPKPHVSSLGGSANINAAVATPNESETLRYVYFDILGQFMFLYPWGTGRFVHLLVCVFTLLWIFQTTDRRSHYLSGFLLATIIQALFLLCGAIFMLMLGYVTHTYGSRLTWYTNRYNLLGLYFMPMITFFVYFYSFFFNLTSYIIFRWYPFKHLLNKSEWIQKRENQFVLMSCYIENDFFKSTTFLLNLLGMGFLCINSLFSYFPILWSSIAIFFRWIYMLIFPTHAAYSTCKKLLIFVPQVIFLQLSSSYLLFDFFIPIYGRTGQLVMADLVMSAVVFLVSFPFLLSLGDLMLFTSNSSSRKLRRVLLNTCLMFAVLIHTTSLGFPYAVRPARDDNFSIPSCQRTLVFHTDRTFRENPLSTMVTSSDSGIFISTADGNRFRYYHNSQPLGLNSFLTKIWGPSIEESERSSFLDLDKTEPFTCQRHMPYCGVPFLYPLLNALDTIYYLPAKRHNSPSSKLEIIKREVQPNLEPQNEIDHFVNLTLSMNSKAAQTHLYIHTNTDVFYLYNWSFAPSSGPPMPVPLPVMAPNEKKTHSNAADFFIAHIDPSTVTSPDGFYEKPLVFWMQFAKRTTPKLQDNLSECLTCIDVATASLYYDTTVANGKSDELTNFLDSLPRWSYSLSYVTSYDHWRLPLTDDL